MSTPESTAPAIDTAAVRAQAQADALAIAELCELAGQPALTATYLAEGITPVTARQRLLGLRAQSPEITSHLLPTAPLSTAAGSLEDNPLMRAIQARAVSAKKER